MKTESYTVTGPQPIITELAEELRVHLQDGLTVDVRPVSNQSDPRKPKHQFPLLELVLSIPVHLVSASIYDIVKAKIEAIRKDQNFKITSKVDEQNSTDGRK
ncbi:hypothetical protein OKW40_001733 [Paraburkholderia sp. RAU6.4a]|uniref:hypothetical protein n=1 Tax=Paraburkholderia sp. RAU6.4a TaxID=2991067 RepID=UPI003D1FDC65